MERYYPELNAQTKDKLIIKWKDKKFDFDYLSPEKSKNCYVYFVISNLELIYIGKGTGDRWQHSISGASHNKFVNEYHKDYGNKCYLVANDMTTKESYKLEYSLIRRLKPIGNIDGNPLYLRTKSGAKRLVNNYAVITGCGDKKRTKNAIKRCKKRKKSRGKMASK